MGSESFFTGIDLHAKVNNTQHHTSEISVDELIVRRGFAFSLTLRLARPFTPELHPLTITASTGNDPSEERGTLSSSSIPAEKQTLSSTTAAWPFEVSNSSSPLTGAVTLNVTVTPPANAPIGLFRLLAKLQEEETLLATVLVLFNPWCPEDLVFLPDEELRNEYVMKEQGIIFIGSGNYIRAMDWDFGHFEENMVTICMKILDNNHRHLEDPSADVSSRCDPVYVGRVVSAMINSEDDCGVLEGRWDESFFGGVSPSHWTGSHTILQRWLDNDCRPVKYGQCWVFAGVMCSVMRLLGVPCRVVTNYQSAHDCDRNLTIDVYHADYGVRAKETRDSIWNFHVWVEAWMRRPDLADDGKYDGWQVLDPTPQEMSDNVYCCGPAPVKAILNGDTHLDYDVPFVFSEVNADCVDWLVKADGTEIVIFSDTKRVGQNISTKSVGSNKRLNITDTYKHREGSDKERAVFKYALSRDFTKGENGGVEKDEEEEKEDEEEEKEDEEVQEEEKEDAENEGSAEEASPESPPPPPKLFIRFEEVSTPLNGKDVQLEAVLHSESSAARPLAVNVSVQAIRYNGSLVANIQTEAKEATLLPDTDLSVPITVPFSSYRKHVLRFDSLKVSVVVTDQLPSGGTYLAEDDVVLQDPPISITVFGETRLNSPFRAEVMFSNPIAETLTDCSLTLSGSGLFNEDLVCSLPDLRPRRRLRVQFTVVPYKSGEKTLVADFLCSTFKDIKGSCSVHVQP